MKEGAPAEAGRALAGSDADALPTVTDEALMTAYAGGDATAFDALYVRHKGALYRYFKRQLNDAEANDCYQALWEKIINNRDRYQPDGPFRSYLFTIAHNVLMDHFRRQGGIAGVTAGVTARATSGAQETDPDSLPSQGSEPHVISERTELRKKLHALILGLPAHQREAWLLRQETDFSTADIARVTGTSEEGVKSRLRYARDKLKQGMARYVS